MNEIPNYNTNRLPYCQPGYYSIMKLAHAYVPFQCMCNIYDPMTGLCRGTIFPELDAPYGADPEFTVDA